MKPDFSGHFDSKKEEGNYIKEYYKTKVNDSAASILLYFFSPLWKTRNISWVNGNQLGDKNDQYCWLRLILATLHD